MYYSGRQSRLFILRIQAQWRIAGSLIWLISDSANGINGYSYNPSMDK